ncbi:hypothetical protein SAMN04488168_11058 [Bacillus sp. 491mf]|uniref:hypothetical protein n=1 Tax=unclassified Bacillus (in: firmicutes) TaxID=185979 RepID=UPI0005541EC4|nr:MULTISPECIES: hypothetical protein [unclassified Bacillus (in: firmicutes)]SFC82962.1 hypothetical protein SAMN04488168_11058 [Bacillus sp. 491mf]
MINEITNENTKQDLMHTFEKIFMSTNPFQYVFTKNIKEVIILFPTDGYYLTEKQFIALQETMVTFKENEFYISEVEGTDIFKNVEKTNSYQSRHWIIDDVTSLHDYDEVQLFLENAIYSTQGKWGLIVSHEEHALLGGTSEFIRRFKMNYPEWEECTNNLLKQWKDNERLYGASSIWVDNLIKSIKSIK